MKSSRHRGVWVVILCLLPCGAAALPLLRSRAASPQGKPSPTPHATAQASQSEAFRLNTLGVAYMNQQKFVEAQKYFEKALAADPKFAIARLNLGISLLSQQQLEPARAALEEAARLRPKDPYAWYNLGLVYKDTSEAEKGIAAFQHVAQLSPEADAHYFLGYLYSQLQRYDEAIAEFQKALSAFPYHASSEFGIARAFQRKGDSESARQHLERFKKITTEHLGAPFGAGYGDQGRFSLAELGRSGVLTAPPATPVTYKAQPVVVAPAGGHRKLPGPSTGACFLDYDGDGKPDLFLVSALDDGASRLLHNAGDGRFVDVTDEAGVTPRGKGLGCAAGDFDNDGHTDLAVCLSDGVHLLRNKGDGKFEEVTQTVGIRREPGCVGVTFVDYDHDGDLDLYITMSSSGAATEAKNHNVLWRNNGNSTFTDISAETGLGIDATGAGLVTSDFNNDRAIDFVFAGGTQGAAIYLNPREGKFSPLPAIDFTKENLPPAVGVVAFDFDKDGWMDLAFTHAGAPGISLWRNVDGKRLERVPLPDLAWQRGWGLAAFDYDNDGWLDLVAAGESTSGGELRLLRNLGASGWKDVTRDVHLDAVKLAQPRAIAVADIAANGSADLVVTQLGGAPLLLRNEGGNQHSWMHIDLKALNDNKSAIGTKVEIYAGPLYQKWEVQGASGYLGQNSPTLLV